MKTLIPDLPDHGAWSQSELLDRCFNVKKLLQVSTNLNFSMRDQSILQSQSHGVYSHSVVWSYIIQHLINRENPLFFKTAAKLCKSLKSTYGPNRWYLSLANCVVKTNDVISYVDILGIDQSQQSTK